MTIKPPNPNDILAWAEEVDTSLAKLELFLTQTFTNVEKAPQVVVDHMCERAGAYVSYGLELLKVKILNGLGLQKKSAEKYMEDYAPLISAIEAIEEPTPENVVGVVANIIKAIKIIYNFVIKPYREAIEFIDKLTTAIIKISDSMQRLARWTPPPAPDINFNKFKITFKPFSISDLGSGNTPIPEPPEKKPFPNPFRNNSDKTPSA